MDTNIQESVQKYYGSTLKTSDDLKTNACCDFSAISPQYKKLLANIEDEVLAKYYGCGFVVPTDLKGARVLDLGCGAGRDVYLLSQLVGEEGQVVGVDMTDSQLAVANKYRESHAEKFGHKNSNVKFINGKLEELHLLGLEPNSFDVIVSNCVINLVTDKPKVFADAYSLLRQGGEFYFSDVYSDRRIPHKLQDDEVLYGECLSGALYTNDFVAMAKQVGFRDPRQVEARELTIEDQAIKDKVGDIKFASRTFRLFKLDELDAICEDYGQAISFKGCAKRFILDDHHIFEKGKVYEVCRNTYRMLNESRFKSDFDFYGNGETHYGEFMACKGAPNEEEITNSMSCC